MVGKEVTVPGGGTPSAAPEAISAGGAFTALGAAMAWALVVAGFGFGVAGWLVLAAGGALTLLSVQLAFRGLRQSDAWGRAVAYGAACSLPVLALMAIALKQWTHHRPLGAVTFAVLALGLLVGMIWAMARLQRWRRAIGFVSGGVVLGGLVLWLATAGEQRTTIGLQWGAGLLLAVLCILVDQRLRQSTFGKGVGMTVWWTALLINLALGLAGWGTALDEVAPVVVGLIGLLR